MPMSPDPVDEPKAYQQHLLSLLGDDDPAVVQTATAGAFRSLLERAGTRASVRPGPTEWSASECLAHVVDAEIVMSGRYRWILAHDEPSLIGYDQDLWVDRLHAGDESVDGLLALFVPLRDADVALWLRSTPEDKARVGLHAERGPESFELAFRMVAGHDRFHLAQANRALE
jgi:DinB family protein